MGLRPNARLAGVVAAASILLWGTTSLAASSGWPWERPEDESFINAVDEADFPATPCQIIQPTAAKPTLDEATFRLCGEPDPQVERSIEQLVGGRSFSVKLSSRSDGCADLTIKVSPEPACSSCYTRQSTNLAMSVGAKSDTQGHGISVQIVTENGVTRATIGAIR